MKTERAVQATQQGRGGGAIARSTRKEASAGQKGDCHNAMPVGGGEDDGAKEEDAGGYVDGKVDRKPAGTSPFFVSGIAVHPPPMLHPRELSCPCRGGGASLGRTSDQLR